MNSIIVKMLLKAQNLMNGEEGQDLVEYALIVSLIALACIVGVGNLSTALKTVFSTISTTH